MFKLRHIGGLTLSGTGLALGAALYVSYNRIIMGEWFLQPLNLVSSAHRLGFGPDIGLNWDTFDTPGHTPWRALLNLNFNLAVLSQDLFGWPLSSLLFVIAFWTIGRDRSDYLLSGLIMLTVVGAYTLYWYHGVAFGARFYFCLLPHLLISTVKGIESVLALLAKWTPHALEHTMARAVWASVGLSFAFGWLVYVPKVGLLGPYHDQRGINSGLYRFVERQGLASAIVFVRVPRQNLFGPAFIANDVPPWSSSVLFALDRGAANQWLIDRFPQRSVHYFSYAPELNPYREFWDRLTWRSDRWPNGPLKK
jgi:hypothetical protein